MSRTEPSTRRLSEVARHVVIPEGIVTTAWPRVVAKCAELGVRFDEWQNGIGQIALGKRKDGKYAATVGGVVLSIPRQVGKTFLVGMIIIALCLLHPGLTVLWTAHRTRTATKTFTSLKGMTSRKKVLPHMLDPRSANGEQEIRFRNGSIIMFGAREQGFGRGFDEVDIEVFDEAQILSEKGLEDMVPAANQSRFESGALLFFMGTPPRPGDPGEEFTNRRDKALKGLTKDHVYVEFSADRNADSDDRKQWEKANPSFPHRTPVESMLRMRENLTDDASFRREALGIWDENASVRPLILPADWKALRTTSAPAPAQMAYGVKFSTDGSRVALAVAVRADPDSPAAHVEVVKVASLAAGNGWLVDALVKVWRDAAVIVIDGKSGSGPLVNALRARKVPERALLLPTVDQVIGAHAMLLEAVATPTLTHFGQKGLDDAVEHATKRPIGKAGGWGWQPIGDTADVTSLEAVTYAHFGLMTTKRKASGDGQGRRAVVM